MYKLGFWLMGAAAVLAALGVFFSDPIADIPDGMNLFRMALHGLEVQMFRVSFHPPRYLLNVLARDWLLGCIMLAAVGAILAAAARLLQRRQHPH